MHKRPEGHPPEIGVTVPKIEFTYKDANRLLKDFSKVVEQHIETWLWHILITSLDGSPTSPVIFVIDEDRPGLYTSQLEYEAHFRQGELKIPPKNESYGLRIRWQSGSNLPEISMRIDRNGDILLKCGEELQAWLKVNNHALPGEPLFPNRIEPGEEMVFNQELMVQTLETLANHLKQYIKLTLLV